jgi:YHS domain-containing protein
MQAERPEKLIDPVCGMTVDVAAAEAAGLLLEYEDRTYAFCRPGCRRAFVEDPATYVAQAEAAEAAAVAAPAQGERALPVIDEGMRRWYESCSCCLSDAYPEIKAQLDAERAAATAAPVDAGICEVAEAAEPEPAVHAH